MPKSSLVENQIYYFEKISFLSFFKFFTTEIVFSRISNKNINILYYVDSSSLFLKILLPFLKILNIKINKLNFEMRNVFDKHGEIERVRIGHNELFTLLDSLTNSAEYKKISNSTWEHGRIRDVINKGLTTSPILEELSAARLVYLLKVVHWHMTYADAANCTFYFKRRPWVDCYYSIAEKLGIKMVAFNDFNLDIFTNIAKNFIRKYPRLYAFIKNNKLKYKMHSRITKKLSTPKIYVEGRGDVNLSNNGYHSDFFWMMNSEFSPNNILYEYHNEDELKALTKHGINTTSGYVNLNETYIKNYQKTEVNKILGSFKEYKSILKIIDSYNSRKIRLFSFFHNHNVKVYLTWNRVGNHHMVAADALNDNNGISVYWPLSFDGYRQVDIQVCMDVIFSYSKFGSDIEKQSNSKFKYNIILGYPKDYAGDLLKAEANKLRKKLQSNGAKKIIFAIDENSVDDSRWHTGHELQQENYSYILEKVMSTSWLGVIFKPKNSKNLRERLGAVSLLLSKAEQTGRCFVYEDTGRFTTSAPPVLAGLSADIAIHGHLCAGTAGLECALQGIPTLLIDREGAYHSKLSELPEGKVVFKNWQVTIDAVIEHFSSPKGIPGFGDWSSIIDDLDPFRDGKAAYRMGTYLNWLIQGYEKGLSKEVVMENAAERYRDKWGDDKVLTE